MQLKTNVVRKTYDSVKQRVESFDSHLKLRHFRIPQYKPNVEFEFSRGNYLVKTASNGDELEAALRLRFEVFHKEFLHKRREIGVDIDKLDFGCDHLVICDQSAGGKIVGTYRLNCSRFTDTFYSAGEFDISGILKLEGHKLELGRACIHKDHRSGVVIHLLWRAIAAYLLKTECQYLFGCGSIKTMDRVEAALIYNHLKAQGHINTDLGVHPTKKFQFPKLSETIVELEKGLEHFSSDTIGAMVPALFSSYLKMGCKICGEPALDREFHCIDFLTLLNVDDLNPLFVKKYRS